MRRVVIVMLILMHSTLSFAGAGADSTSIESRQSDLDVIGLEQVTVHREELIEVFLTLHNIGENDETFSFQVESEIEGLTTTGLPCTQFVESGYLRQVKFNLTAEATANFGNYNLELNFTSESDQYPVENMIWRSWDFATRTPEPEYFPRGIDPT